MYKYILSFSAVILSSKAFAERGVNVDVHGFLASINENIISGGEKIFGAAVILTALGLMIPGFREGTKRSLPWTILGILGIILVTKYLR